MKSERNNQNVNLLDDLFIFDSSKKLYPPSSQLTSSENEEKHDIELIDSNAGKETFKFVLSCF